MCIFFLAGTNGNIADGFAFRSVYYLVFSFSGSYKFGVLVLFKLAATVFGGITVRIVHKVVAMNGHGDALRTAAAMKFFIEVSYEIYVFFTIHDLHGWPLFSAYLLMEMAILTFECWHDEESALDAWLKYPSMWLQRLKNANSPPAEPTPLPPKAKDHHVSHHSANHEGEHHAHNLVDMDAVAASNAMLHVEGRKHFNARVLHYCVAVQARIYGAIATTVLLPTWYYGPNRDWYIFEFSSLDLWNSLGLVWLSVGVTLVHVLLTRHFVWKAFKIDLVVAWVGYADTFSDYFWAAYTTAPVFPAVQLGRQWGMVWFFRRISGLGVPNIP
ncbi:uncharacterized protein EV422DRAFT_539531 [Fimicolochytrium jonesii]|uniref:uncharacterized protein n=1 Tax=Fimicolochytrium jonesii TaxID=1396493 RepID=UPI0022FE5499|nr:uncharacterized protein EV422DRAFT_539531 [Fimicolochytrium jonesii]KAI8817984.1 hypothetical protein EV422DRAFT_539531 [Fimicolochytrium jonesii]